MTKLEVQSRVLKNGRPLSMDLFSWDEETRTFWSAGMGLVLDFKGVEYCTFNTGHYCTFKTGCDCTFNTGYGCTFNAGHSCTFNTGYGCTFNTGSDCTFNAGCDCVVVRRDVYEVIELRERVRIKLNAYGIKGYYVIEVPKVETIKIGDTEYDKAEVEAALKNVKRLN